MFFNITMTQHTSRLCKGYLTKKESDGVLYQKTDMLSTCGNSFKTLVKAFLVKLVERMPRVCKAVIKAKGGYVEESQI